MKQIIVGVSGASGSILAIRVIEELLRKEVEVSLVVTAAGLLTATEELGSPYGRIQRWEEHFGEQNFPGRLQIYSNKNFFAPFASGSHLTDGMVIVPCSMGTLAAVALGLADNLLRRAADVVLKERRRLVIVPRETPMSPIHLRHQLTLAEMGAIIFPPIPAWYMRPKSLDEVEIIMVGRILDALGIANSYPRWGDSSKGS
ncbi:MAG: UbiX family flavin prenyltransferase [Chlamydiia bacterium]|nr:UbiX family flavin prenyltransferase [Chlamydiia bacterium]